jgi:hypothetical protein
MMIKGLLFLLLTSCATTSKKDNLAFELANKSLSETTILDLARASYLKGCIEGKNTFGIMEISGFDYCLKMAKEHEKEIATIINTK